MTTFGSCSTIDISELSHLAPSINKPYAKTPSSGGSFILQTKAAVIKGEIKEIKIFKEILLISF